MSQQEFNEVTHKLKLLNPFADIGVSSKSTSVIWSKTVAEELTLPPMLTLSNGRLMYEKSSIEVRAYE